MSDSPQTREQQPTPASPSVTPSSGGTSGASVQLKSSLRGQDLATQMKSLTPVQRKSEARETPGAAEAIASTSDAPVQRRAVQRTGPEPTPELTPAEATPEPPIKPATREADVRAFCAGDPVAMQKLADVDNEAYLADVAPAEAKAGFYKGVGDYINANYATAPNMGSAIYSLCFNNMAKPYKMKGTPIAQDQLAGLCSRTTGLGGFFWTAVKREPLFAAARTILGTGANQKDVEGAAFSKFRADVQGGGVDLMSMLDTGATILPDGGGTWFTDDKVSLTDGSNTGFGELMEIFALQPEWFADGNVLFEIEPSAFAGQTRKPTAYDGMQSSLWVARNQGGQAFGVTGGGAREFLAGGVKVSGVTSARAVIPTADFRAEIRALVTAATEAFLASNPDIKKLKDEVEAGGGKLDLSGILTDQYMRGAMTSLDQYIPEAVRTQHAQVIGKLSNVASSTREETTTPGADHAGGSTVKAPSTIAAEGGA